MLLILALVAFLSLFINLHRYPFRGEESLRTIVAFEMWHSKSYLQPTFLGEPYYNKPPLFNWLILLSSHLIPWSELTARAVSLASLLLLALFTYLFSYHLSKNHLQASMASFILITFGSLFFFYGYLAEVDTTFTLFLFVSTALLYLWWRSDLILYALLSGLFFGLSFMIKGFPAYAFLLMSLLALVAYSKSIRRLFGIKALLLYLSSLLIPALWLLSLPEPLLYLSNLWRESFSRVGGDFSRLRHMLTYPLINFKDLLPWSALFLFLLFKQRKSTECPAYIRPLLLLLAFNYIPYWVSNSAGRYVIPLYPLLAIVFSHYFTKALEDRAFKKLFLSLAFASIILRLLYGLFFFPYWEQKETSRKRIALDIFSLAGKSPIACECPEEKSVCLYVGIFRGEPLKRLSLTPSAEYVINCSKPSGSPLKTYPLKDKEIRLERLNY
jgi:4-amino-4-deoxy-L-arabinose transferase-like glycosyltransferase